jgi:hypothetical protein
VVSIPLPNPQTCEALFIYLYGADPNLTVSPGRTGNATRPSLFSSPPPIPSDSATDRLRAICPYCRSSASFISRDSWGCATISLGSEKMLWDREELLRNRL